VPGRENAGARRLATSAIAGSRSRTLVNGASVRRLSAAPPVESNVAPLGYTRLWRSAVKISPLLGTILAAGVLKASSRAVEFLRRRELPRPVENLPARRRRFGSPLLRFTSLLLPVGLPEARGR
jgi:hypothetical protein